MKNLLELRTHKNNKLVSCAALLTALLFAVHPINTETVAWISASKFSLYMLFGLSALLCYLRYLKSGNKLFCAFSVALFILSFGCTEQALALPLIVPLIDWFVGRNLRDKKLWIEKIPFLLLIIAVCLFMLLLRNPFFVQYRAYYPIWQYIVFTCYALTEYLTKLVFPVNLLHLYPIPIVPGESLPVRFFIYPFMIVAMAGIAVYYRKYTMLIFGLLFFLFNVLLTLHPISTSRIIIAADRHIYLAGIGFLMTAALVWGKIFQTSCKHGKDFCRCCLCRLLNLSDGIRSNTLGSMAR